MEPNCAGIWGVNECPITIMMTVPELSGGAVV